MVRAHCDGSIHTHKEIQMLIPKVPLLMMRLLHEDFFFSTLNVMHAHGALMMGMIVVQKYMYREQYALAMYV